MGWVKIRMLKLQKSQVGIFSLQSKCQLGSSIRGVGLASGSPWPPIYSDISWYHSHILIYCHISSHRKQYKCHTLEQGCWTCIRVALAANICCCVWSYCTPASKPASAHCVNNVYSAPYASDIICISALAQIASAHQTKTLSTQPRAYMYSSYS